MTDSQVAKSLLPGASLPWKNFGNSRTWTLEIGELDLLYQVTLRDDVPVRLERWTNKMYDLQGVEGIAGVEKIVRTELDAISAAWDSIKSRLAEPIETDGLSP